MTETKRITAEQQELIERISDKVAEEFTNALRAMFENQIKPAIIEEIKAEMKARRADQGETENE